MVSLLPQCSLYIHYCKDEKDTKAKCPISLERVVPTMIAYHLQSASKYQELLLLFTYSKCYS